MLALLCPTVSPIAAQGGFFMPAGQKQVDIPFDYINNFIIITVRFNGVFPLKFIFDTGAEHTILSKREISDLMRVTYEKEFRVKGSDLKTDLVAYLARRIRFDIPDKVSAPREDILVLQEDYFRFEEYAGIDVHGILSANAFSKYIIRINYDRRIITLYDRESFKIREDGYEPIPIEVYRNKIYMNSRFYLRPDSIAPIKLLIDTGAGLPLLMFSNTHPLVHPPDNAITTNIGMGLGGYLEGFTGRVFQLDLGKFSEKNIVTYFQTLDSTMNEEYLHGRNGLIGNTLLGRFSVIFDYQNSTMWLKPARNFRNEFVYDRSGLIVIATGPGFGKFVVQGVIDNSPAAEADIRKGDEIKRIGIAPAAFLSLGDVQRIFQKKPGKKVKIIIKRDGKRIKKRIVLRDLI
ncbi:MAG: aspartyl protease family protein [Lewinellaceae bacterium]|nr:aspartyl protease family protein [Lewinellaceae bacterium]